MERTKAPGTAVEKLAGHLLDRERQDPLTEELIGWLAGSARFRAFAEAHRDKIRKKLRTAADDEALRDVRTELQVARLLLLDKRIELAFEAYGSGKVGPDLTVTFRGRRSFNLEGDEAAPRARRDWPRGVAARQASAVAAELAERGARRDRGKHGRGARCGVGDQSPSVAGRRQG